jgi:CDP-paratose 2-epimerase
MEDEKVRVLITGSSGLIGSECVRFFDNKSDMVIGMDNNMRAEFFGSDGDTLWMKNRLLEECKNFRHVNIDIRDRQRVSRIIEEISPDLLIHAAAQPSHDLAAKVPFIDFEVNAMGTLNLLEATRQGSPESVFVFLSTNKVYGDTPNCIKLKELSKRWDYDDPEFAYGIPETLTIDQSKHSLFGASKLSADIMVQEYGKYFDLKTVTLRGGCLTGSSHSGAELHGFLSYFFKCVLNGRQYTIFGYKGKQVRDNIHSYDVATAIYEIYKNPKCGEVYNIGGGKENSISILETIEKIEQVIGKKISYKYSGENRSGDHICYYTDLRKFKNDYPDWEMTRSLDNIFEEFAQSYS